MIVRTMIAGNSPNGDGSPNSGMKPNAECRAGSMCW
jgi:hypothetical protein